MTPTSRSHGSGAILVAVILAGAAAGRAMAAAPQSGGAAPPDAGSAASSSAAPDPTAPAAAGGDEAADARLKALEAELVRLQAEVAALQARAGGGGTAAPAPTTEDLQKQVDALSREVARLRQTKEPAEADRSYEGLAPAASKPHLAKKGLTIGGYGSALYERFTRRADNDTIADVPNRASLTEAFFYVGYRFDDHFVFNSSFGIEDAVVESGSDGKATIEFAYIDYRARKAIGVRGGLVLMPIGFLNEQHEPGEYLSARRPEVELRIIPTTWREIGGGVYGAAGPVQWRAYVVTSLDAAGFDPSTGVAGGRQQGANAVANDIGVTARVDWSVIADYAHGTLLLGTSGFTGNTGQGAVGFPEGRFSLWETHADYRYRGLRTRALYARGIQSGAEEISLAIDPAGATAIGDRLRGWYAEVGYDLMTLTQWKRQELIPFCRYESLNTQDQVPSGFTADPANDLTVKTCGVEYQPIRGVILKLDTQNFDQQAHTAVDQYNLALGWTF
jgi:hypothetical protein